jgi:hypothetical protein
MCTVRTCEQPFHTNRVRTYVRMDTCVPIAHMYLWSYMRFCMYLHTNKTKNTNGRLARGPLVPWYTYRRQHGILSACIASLRTVSVVVRVCGFHGWSSWLGNARPAREPSECRASRGPRPSVSAVADDECNLAEWGCPRSAAKSRVVGLLHIDVACPPLQIARVVHIWDGTD